MSVILTFEIPGHPKDGDKGWMASGLARGQPSAVQASRQAGRVTIAGHPSKEAAPGTLKSILKQAGIES